MISLFKPTDPIARLESALSDNHASREKLAARLTAGETMLAEKRTAAEQLAVAGADDDQLDGAEAAIRAAADRVDTLRAALASLDEQIAKTEAELAEARAQRDRELVAAELDTMAAAIRTAAPEFDAAALKLLEAVTKNRAVMTEANSFAARVDEVRHSIIAIAHMIATEVIANAEHVRKGRASIAFRTERSDPLVDVGRLESAAPVNFDA